MSQSAPWNREYNYLIHYLVFRGVLRLTSLSTCAHKQQRCNIIKLNWAIAKEGMMNVLVLFLFVDMSVGATHRTWDPRVVW